MPLFDTPGAVRVVLHLTFGQVRIFASDRADTVVEVFPRDPADQADLRTCERARSDYTDGRLTVVVPEPDRGTDDGGAVIIEVRVPIGSSVHGRAMAVDFLGVGELGECRLRTGLGHIRLDRTGSLQLNASIGNIAVRRAVGAVEAGTDRGNVCLDRIEGRVTARTLSEGDIGIGEVLGVARLQVEKGDISIGRAHTGVQARATQGEIAIGRVARGSVAAEAAFGGIRIGVAETSAARLVLDATAGTVYTSLVLLEENEHAEEIVHVHARTGIGDIIVERADPEADPEAD